MNESSKTGRCLSTCNHRLDLEPTRILTDYICPKTSSWALGWEHLTSQSTKVDTIFVMNVVVLETPPTPRTTPNCCIGSWVNSIGGLLVILNCAEIHISSFTVVDIEEQTLGVQIEGSPGPVLTMPNSRGEASLFWTKLCREEKPLG